jgi:uroporphyrinogen-III synthase
VPADGSSRMSTGCRRVVLTQPLPRVHAVAQALQARGHETLLLPYAQIESLTSTPAASAILGTLADCDRVVFVSPMAISSVLEALGGVWPAGVAPIVVGPGSREVLDHYGLGSHPLLAMPTGPVYDAKAVLALPVLAAPAGERIIVVRALGGNTEIENELARRGARVRALEAYRRKPCHPAPDALTGLAEWLHDPAAVELVVTTVEAGERVARLADTDARLRGLRVCRALTIHPRVVGTLRAAGWPRVACVAPGLAALLAAIESADRAAQGAPSGIGTERD